MKKAIFFPLIFIISLCCLFLSKSFQSSFAQDLKIDLENLSLGQIEPQMPQSSSRIAPLSLSRDLPFQPDEEILFDAYHKTPISRVLAGHCRMKLGQIKEVSGKWVMPFTLEAVSADWYKWVFVLKNTISGYFDLSSGKTIWLDEEKKEQSYLLSKIIAFDYEKGQVMERYTNKNKVTKYQQFKLQTEVVDTYSIVYLIRRGDLSKNKNIRYDVYDDGSIYALHAEVVSEESIRVQQNTYDTYKVKLLTKVTGALEQKGGIYVYFTKDKFKKPVLVEGDVAIGIFSLEAR